MGEKQDEFEEIDGVYTEEKKQLGELEERFKTLEVRRISKKLPINKLHCVKQRDNFNDRCELIDIMETKNNSNIQRKPLVGRE